MKRILVTVLISSFWTGNVLANCDLSRFRWECELPVKSKTEGSSNYYVDCGGTPVGVTQGQHTILKRYHNRSIVTVLEYNGEVVDALCRPADKR